MLLYKHVPGKGFYLLSEDIGEVATRSLVGRGGVQADFDRDGRWDLLVMRFGGTPLFLRNTSATNHHWIECQLRQDGGNTRALGALLEVTSGGQTRAAQAGGGVSYLSQHSDVIHWGLGTSEKVDRLRIRWPDGAEDIYENLEVNRRHEFRHVAGYASSQVRSR
jgi:hypothetical protein